jgi:hypothetical protein
MVEVCQWLHCHTWIASPYICQAVPWRNSFRVNSPWDHLSLVFLYPQALQDKSKAVCERCSLCAKNNPDKGQEYLLNHKSASGTPFENLIVDHWNATNSRMQISVGVCLYLLMMCGSLPYMNWKGSGHSQMSVKGNYPLVWIPVYWVR